MPFSSNTVTLIKFGKTLVCAGLLSGCATMGTTSINDQATEQPVATFEDIVIKADNALRSGDLDGAQINYALAIEKNPESVAVAYKLALVHKHKSSFKVAEKLLRHALTVDNAHEPTKILLGQVLTQLERTSEAKALFNQALIANSNSVAALNGLGILSDMDGLHPEAQQYFLNALSLESRSAKLTNNLGYSYYLAGDFQNAERLFSDAVKFDKEYGRAWSNLALLYTRSGQLRAADAAFRKVIPDHQAANNIGYISYLEGDHELAQQQFSRAIDVAPVYYERANRNLELLLD